MTHQILVRKELSEGFFYRRVDKVAEELLGKLLTHETEEGKTGGIIVETEAYLGKEDPASHLVKAGEKRKKVFDKGAGTVYVFKIYQHNNLNFITEYDGVSEGVLVRALDPVKGIDMMKQRRDVEKEAELTSGPGRLTEALGVTKENENGQSLEESRVSVYDTDLDTEIRRTGRISISKAKDWPLRFIAENNEHVSTSSSTEIDRDFDILDYYN